MTVETDKAKSGPFIVTGAIDAFPRDFLILDETHLRVIRVRNEIETDLTTGISHTGIGTPDGTVTVSSNIEAGDVIYLLRSVPSVQQTDYNSQGRVRTEQIEQDLDLLTMQLQDVREAQSRALTLTLSSDVTGPEAMAAALAAPAYAAQAQEAANLVLGMSPLSHYIDRAAATVANVSPQASHIAVAGLMYVRDEAGTALTTGDGSKWTPILTITPQAFGADGVGGDATAANTALQAHLNNTRGSIIIPKGDYALGGVTYGVDSETLIMKSGAIPTNLFDAARANQILLVAETPDNVIQDRIHSRIPLNITIRARGAQHGSGVRSNLQNQSSDGNGCTAFYGSAVGYLGSNWSAAVHGETKHAGGTSICLSAEAASFNMVGNFFGAVISNTTMNGDVTHPGGGAPTAHPTATALLIQGTHNAGAAGGWAYGIDFSHQSMRVGGTDIRFRSLVGRHIHVDSAAPASVADILLEANSENGVLIRGIYSGAALGIGANQKFALENTAQVAMRFNQTNQRIEFLNGSIVRGYVDMAAGTDVKMN